MPFYLRVIITGIELQLVKNEIDKSKLATSSICSD